MGLEITKGTVIRTICLALALINQVLVMFGKSPLPIEDAAIEALVSTAWTIASAVWAWWKNNDFTLNARRAGKYLRDLKGIDAK